MLAGQGEKRLPINFNRIALPGLCRHTSARQGDRLRHSAMDQAPGKWQEGPSGERGLLAFRRYANGSAYIGFIETPSHPICGRVSKRYVAESTINQALCSHSGKKSPH